MSQLEMGWTEQNQRYLSAELRRLKARLGGELDEEALVETEQARNAMKDPPAIDVVAGLFRLTRFERELLLLCAGVELDEAFVGLCERISGRPRASFSLGMSQLADPHWSALTPVAPLRRWKLATLDERAGVSRAELRIEERVLHYLVGINYLEPRLQPLVQPAPVSGSMAPSHEAIVRLVEQGLVARPLQVIQLIGNDRAGTLEIAAQASTDCGLQLLVMQECSLPDNPQDLELLADLWGREAALMEVSLLIECQSRPGPAVKWLAETVAGLVMISAQGFADLQRRDLRLVVRRPGSSEQMQMWQSALNGHHKRLGTAVQMVAGEFRLSARDVHRAARHLDGVDPSGDLQSELWGVCRTVPRSGLDELAQRIDPGTAWDDLVLPAYEKATLHRIAAQARHRTKVYEEWGFEGKSARGLGITALFAGESGTGKTMAAEVLANELRLDLYRIDLSSVVSKYIGETEKNLARIFDAADLGGVLLLFDEADALFGKRSEVKDSHDRYANIEVGFLLQRMEEFRGLAVLTTNQRSALDPSFQRRLRFSVNFPFPSFGEREEIWRRVFPAGTPMAELAYPHLAQLQMAGGHIRSIALHAAFQAAEEGGPVSMDHILQAAHAEAARGERVLSDAETRGWR